MSSEVLLLCAQYNRPSAAAVSTGTGVPCKSQQVSKHATYSEETVELLLRVLHGMPVAPVGVQHTQIKLALDEKLLEQDQNCLGIEVAAR